MKRLKRMLAVLLQHFWGFGFGATASFRATSVARLTPDGQQKILILAPHPDDESIGCAGTAMLHVGAGDRVCVAIATDGRQSRAIGDPEKMAAQRKREAEDAINILQIQRLEWVGLPEGAWAAATLEQALRKILTDQSPDILYAPSKIDFHPEHVKVAHALALALHAHPNPPRLIRVYQIQVPLTAVLTNLVADVSALASRCDAALRAYVSQAGAVRSAHRLRVYAAKRHHCAYQAEEFWQISVAHYIRLHRLEAPQRITAFRGLRHFPLTDPIAYLKGRKHRRDCLEPQQPSM